MQRNFIYFINPISGTKNKAPLYRLIETTTRKKNISFKILETKQDGDYSFPPLMINAENITDIIICGGDGTVSQVTAFLLNAKVNIGIIPMGSGNGLALTAGISKSAEQALEIIFKGNTAPVDGFYINGHFSCMLCGLGFDAKVAQDFAEQPSRGLFTYVKQTVKNFFSARTYPFSIEIDQKIIYSEAFFISIANSNQFGNHVTIAPKASLNDGLLDIVIVNKMNKIQLLYFVLKQIRLGVVQHVTAKNIEKKRIIYLQTGKLIIQNPSMAPLHIDGDPAATAKSFDIQIIRGAFRLLQP